ncbi:MAG TPA: hypothetical protein VF756_12300 [Thermoanaerobaculia bacterium]
MGKDDPAGPAGPKPDLDALLERLGGTGPLLERLARAQAALDRERADAPGLCSELLALPREQQPERAAGDPRFHTWGLSEELLRRGLETAEADPREAARLAELALTASARLDAELHATPLLQDLEARIWACLGDVRLRTGDLPGAEEALREAALRLARGTGDLLVEARLLEFEAAVRKAQARPREAAALLKQAEARYREVNEPEMAARVRRERDQLLQAP